MFGSAVSILPPLKNMPKNAKKRRFSRGETSWKKRPWKPVGTREDPWGPAPHTRLDFPIYRLFVCSLGPMRNGRPRQCPMAAPNALCLLWRTSSPFRSIILFPQLETREGDQPPQNFPRAETCVKPETQRVGVGFPSPVFQLPDAGCGKLESVFHKVDVENHVPGVKSWNSNSNFQTVEVGF